MYNNEVVWRSAGAEAEEKNDTHYRVEASPVGRMPNDEWHIVASILEDGGEPSPISRAVHLAQQVEREGSFVKKSAHWNSETHKYEFNAPLDEETVKVTAVRVRKWF